MYDQEEKSSFGQIIAVIGAILIAVGVAWLIAQNWHYIPDFIKIFILVLVTLGSYTAGVILKEKDYEKIAQSLFIVGSLLFTLTIFQIAQIFKLSTSSQATAWLWFFCFIGVFVAGFLFKSKLVINIGIAEFLIWVFLQKSAFLSSGGSYFSHGLFSLFGIFGGFDGGHVGAYNSILAQFFSTIGLLIAIYAFITFSKEEKTINFFAVGLIISLLAYWFFLFFFGVHTFTLQESCFIILFSLVILTICAYASQSGFGIAICIINFFIWLIMQFIRILDLGNEISPAPFAFLFLIAGVFFYGLYLVHKSIFNHKFSKCYQVMTVLYFLIFTYILSFQFLVTIIWEGSISGYAIAFLVCFGFVAFLTFIVGVFSSIEKRAVSSGEIIFFALTIIVLLILLFLTSLTTNTKGTCYLRSCNDYKNSDLCNNVPAISKCEWINEVCDVKNCYNYRSQSKCSSADPLLNCEWIHETCSQKSCGNYYNNEELCKQNSQIGCIWINYTSSPRYREGYCSETSCHSLSQDACVARSNCEWSGRFCSDKKIYRNAVSDTCTQFNNKMADCVAKADCKWMRNESNIYKGKNLPTIVWIVWIIINVAFIGFILLVIGYGTLERDKGIINIGIITFALEIITRYIGFIIDFSGYTTLSIIFIMGGIILIFGGWGVERWRRSLIKSIEQNERI